MAAFRLRQETAANALAGVILKEEGEGCQNGLRCGGKEAGDEGERRQGRGSWALCPSGS